MIDQQNDFPRDLRAFCCDTEEDADGIPCTLFDPANSYDNLCHVQRELKKRIADPNTPIDYAASLRDELELVKRLQGDLERRILNSFDPRPPLSNTEAIAPNHSKIDYGAKSKIEKAIADAKAGRYDRNKRSKTLKAVRYALAYSVKNGRMPSHGEVKAHGYNDQQASDAGKWLAMMAGPEPDEESLFRPLHRPKQGRPKKK